MFTRKLGWSLPLVELFVLLPAVVLALSVFPPAVAEAQAQAPAMTADRDEAQECSLATLEGNYGVVEQGTFLFTPAIPGVPTAPFPAVNHVLATYDGKGNVSGQWTASFGGVIVAGTFAGKYGVKPDCTFSVEFTAAPLGATFQEVGTITGRGPFQEIHLMYSNPGMVVTGTGKRIPERGCSLRTLKGNYAVFGQGTTTAKVPGLNLPPPVFWAHSGVFTSDGAGHFVGQNSESVDGTTVSDRYAGTYTINPDCTTSVIINTSLGLQVHETGTLVGLGEYLGIITDEGWVFVENVRPSADSRVEPWNGTWPKGDATIVGKCEDGTLSFVESGTGYMDQMGKTTWSNKYCMDPVTWKGSGNATLTAANGDEIRVQTAPQFTWTSPSAGTWSETEVITGGTGRFAEAMGFSESSGSFTLTSPLTAVWQGTTKGVLSY